MGRLLSLLYPSFWYYLFQRKRRDESWHTVIWCRFRGHPYPVVWFNPDAHEPDMHCTNCGDDLG